MRNQVVYVTRYDGAEIPTVVWNVDTSYEHYMTFAMALCRRGLMIHIFHEGITMAIVGWHGISCLPPVEPTKIPLTDITDEEAEAMLAKW